MSESGRAPKPKRNSSLTKPAGVSAWGPGPFSSDRTQSKDGAEGKSATEGGNSHSAQPPPGVDGEETFLGNASAAKTTGRSECQATRLMALADGAELFHTRDGTGYASLVVGDHRETWAILSPQFRRWLVKKFYEAERRAPNAQALRDAIATVDAKANFDGHEEEVFVRVAERDGDFYLDLADDQWRAVKITPTGWMTVDVSPVRFRRSRGMLALPEPVRGGAIDGIYEFLNVRPEDKALILAWTSAAMRPRGPYPILNVHGEQGTAKSSTQKVLRALVDPNESPLRTLPHDERDLQIAAYNAHMLAFDNVSHLQPWQSDTLCRLATGAGLATRELFTDRDEAIFQAQRPILLNGIEDLAAHGDYLQRSIITYSPEISETARRPEEEFWPAFEAARRRILGTLLDAMTVGLRNLKTVHLERKPRMADFAIWSVATAPALGFEGDTFLKAYSRNTADANTLAIESSMIAPYICAFVEEKGEWTGTASELLDKISLASEKSTRERGWPKTPRALSGALRRLAPNLRSAGISVTFPPREAGTGRRLIKLENPSGSSSRPSPSSPLGDEAASRKTPRSHQLSQEPETSQVACSKKEAGDSCDGRDDKRAHLEVDL